MKYLKGFNDVVFVTDFKMHSLKVVFRYKIYLFKSFTLAFHAPHTPIDKRSKEKLSLFKEINVKSEDIL